MSENRNSGKKVYLWVFSGCLGVLVLGVVGFAALFYIAKNFSNEILDYLGIEFEEVTDYNDSDYGAGYVASYEFDEASLEGVVVLPLAQEREVQKKVVELVSKERFAEADAVLDELLQKNAYGVNGFLVYGQTLGCIYESQGDFALERCMQWLEATRSSHALALSGEAYIDAAWEARGSSWASTVTEDGWRIFHHNLEQARVVLEEAISEQPRNGYAYSRLVTVCMGQGASKANVLEVVKRSEKHAPHYLKTHYSAAYYLLPRWYGSHEEQMDFLDTHMKGAPDNGYKYNTLLEILYWDNVKRVDGYMAQRHVRKQWKRVLDSWAKTWPDATKPLQLKLDIYYDLDKFREAIDLCKQAIERNSENSIFYRRMGQCHLRLAEYAQAVEPLRRACELAPNDLWAHYWFGEAAYYSEKYEVCIEPFKRALVLFEGDTERIQKTHDYLAYAYSKTGDSEVALEHANTAVEMNRNDSWAYYHRGIIRTQLGERKEAKLDFHKCISLDPYRKADIERFYPGWDEF